MSAFALRKRLLKEQEASSSPSPAVVPDSQPSTDPDASIISSPANAPSRRKRQKRAQKDVPPSTSTHDIVEGSHKDQKIISNLEVTEVSPANDDHLPEDNQVADVVQLSNFKPSKANCQSKKDGSLVLKLTEGERLVLLGSYGIRVLSGGLTIQGAVLSTSKHIYWVDAPHCHALPVIRCPEDASLELHSDPRAPSLRQLGRLSPQFRRLWNENSGNPVSAPRGKAERSFQILYDSSDGPKRASLQDLISPPEWNREVSRLANTIKSRPVSVMVTGPKSSGKSTFGKILANRLITDLTNNTRSRRSGKIAVLDLDPGQPEFSLPGQISLVSLGEPNLGPSFCHPVLGHGIEMIRSHTIASVSPASDPDLYLEAASDLMVHYRNRMAAYSLIVNTPGWIQGTGLDILSSLISSLKPSEVVYMSISGPEEAVESLQAACASTPFIMLPSQTAQNGGGRTPAQLRAMQTMSYFHAQTETLQTDERSPWNTSPLTADAPWLVRYAGGVQDRGIFGIICYDYQAPLELLSDTINGTVLAAVEIEGVSAFRLDKYAGGGHGSGPDIETNDDAMVTDDSQSQGPSAEGLEAVEKQLVKLTPEGLPIIDSMVSTTLDPRHCHCIGLVLVRGVDAKNGSLHLSTPIARKMFEDIATKGNHIVLVSGKFDSPSWAYTEDLYMQEENQDESEGMQSASVPEGSRDPEDPLENEPNQAVSTPTPWIQVLRGNQKRNVGSKVWRVRRDLGRS